MSSDESWWVESHEPPLPVRMMIRPCKSKAEAFEVAAELEKRGHVIDGIIKTWNALAGHCSKNK